MVARPAWARRKMAETGVLNRPGALRCHQGMGIHQEERGTIRQRSALPHPGLESEDPISA